MLPFFCYRLRRAWREPERVYPRQESWLTLSGELPSASGAERKTLSRKKATLGESAIAEPPRNTELTGGVFRSPRCK